MKNWTTAENETIPFDKVTHQHWSNIYWYNFVFSNKNGMPKGNMINIAKMALQRIEDNFNGELLSWKPVYWFEINWLHGLDILSSGVRIKNRTEIFHYDKKIGIIVEENLREVKGII